MRRDYREAPLHIAIFEYLGLVLIPPTFAFHIPNGGYRLKREAAELKRMGVRAGMPDCNIIHDGRLYCAEIKFGNARLNADQEVMIPRLYEAGCPYPPIWRSIEDARATLRAWKIPTREVQQ